MKKSRAVIVGGASAVMLSAGWAAAPPSLTAGPGSAGDSPDGAGATESSSTTETFAGPAVANMRGEYQVRLHVEAGVVVDVEFPVAGTEAAESRRINARALPVLEERILEAQSWDVEYVSGASFSSPAMVESARAAFKEAGL